MQTWSASMVSSGGQTALPVTDPRESREWRVLITVLVNSYDNVQLAWAAPSKADKVSVSVHGQMAQDGGEEGGYGDDLDDEDLTYEELGLLDNNEGGVEGEGSKGHVVLSCLLPSHCWPADFTPVSFCLPKTSCCTCRGPFHPWALHNCRVRLLLPTPSGLSWELDPYSCTAEGGHAICCASSLSSIVCLLALVVALL